MHQRQRRVGESQKKRDAVERTAKRISEHTGESMGDVKRRVAQHARLEDRKREMNPKPDHGPNKPVASERKVTKVYNIDPRSMDPKRKPKKWF